MMQVPSTGLNGCGVASLNRAAETTMSALMTGLATLAQVAEARGLSLSARLLHATHVELLRTELRQQLAQRPAVNDGRFLRITYVSRMTDTAGAAGGCFARAVAAGSAARNAAHGITGALCFGEGWFAQVIEGPSDSVVTLFEKISADPRHRDVQVIDHEQSSARLFGNWSMGLADETPAHLIRKAAKGAAQLRRASISGGPTGAARDLHAVMLTALARQAPQPASAHRLAG